MYFPAADFSLITLTMIMDDVRLMLPEQPSIDLLIRVATKVVFLPILLPLLSISFTVAICASGVNIPGMYSCDDIVGRAEELQNALTRDCKFPVSFLNLLLLCLFFMYFYLQASKKCVFLKKVVVIIYYNSSNHSRLLNHHIPFQLGATYIQMPFPYAIRCWLWAIFSSLISCMLSSFVVVPGLIALDEERQARQRLEILFCRATETVPSEESFQQSHSSLTGYHLFSQKIGNLLLGRKSG